MCRYGFHAYKPHYACFKCQKSFKRRLHTDFIENTTDFRAKEAKCPDCGGMVADMGLDFKTPKKKDNNAWKHLQTLYSVGITFHSCGCSGPGYIPKNHADLVTYYQNMVKGYEKELLFWRKRIEPTNESEKAKEWNKNSDKIGKMWGVKSNELGIIENEAAVAYCIDLIQQVNQKLKTLA